MNNFYVITGGPGAGKTALINELQRSGFSTVPEAARRIIQEQSAVGGTGLPWKNKAEYAALMLAASVESYQRFAATHPQALLFFDRGVLDTFCYQRMEGIPITAAMETLAATCRYNPHVFLLPPWEGIYETDTERKQSWDEAVFTYAQMKQTYLDYGYAIVEVPRVSVAERRVFVVAIIEAHSRQR